LATAIRLCRAASDTTSDQEVDFEFVRYPNLRALEISDRIIKTQYSIAHHKDRAHSPIIKAFIETVRRMKAD
jgi:hypothetical protein